MILIIFNIKKCCNPSFIIPPVLLPDRTGCMWEKPLWKTGSVVSLLRANLALGWISPVQAYSPVNIHLSAEQEGAERRWGWPRDHRKKLPTSMRDSGTVSVLRGDETREPFSDNSSDHFSSIHCSIACSRQLKRLTEGLGSQLSKTSRQ